MRAAVEILLLGLLLGACAPEAEPPDASAPAVPAGPAEASAAAPGGGAAPEPDDVPLRPVVQGPGWPVSFAVPVEDHARYPRVILVSIDTLRYDHLSMNGYPRPTSPFIDSLAERGVRFERAIASVSHTTPSHATMLTGLPPAVHGVLTNGQAMPTGAMDLARLHSEAGFRTIAIVNAGFLKGVAASFDQVSVQVPDTERVADAACAWIKAREPSERFFMWIHLFDPHHWKLPDRIPGSELAEIREGTALSDDELYDYVAELHGLPDPPDGEPFVLEWDSARKLHTPTRRDYLDFVDNYDALILHANHQLERIYRAAAEKGFDDTLWIVTADHGEGLASHGIAGHGGWIYQEQLHVPLVIHAADGSLGPRSVSDVVQHVDLYPTLAENLRARVVGMDPQLHGASLWPLIEGRAGWSVRPAFSQRRPASVPVEALSPKERREAKRREREEAKEPEDDFFALQTDRFKYILHLAAGDELYDLQRDRLELRNEIASPDHERERAALGALLKARVELFRENPNAREQEIPDELLEELRDLGYVE